MVSENPQKNEEPAQQMSFADLLKSVFSAFLGVQSEANRERDFKHGKMSHFIIIGLIFGLLFVVTLVTVVQIVLHLASAN